MNFKAVLCIESCYWAVEPGPYSHCPLSRSTPPGSSLRPSPRRKESHLEFLCQLPLDHSRPPARRCLSLPRNREELNVYSRCLQHPLLVTVRPSGHLSNSAASSIERTMVLPDFILKTEFWLSPHSSTGLVCHWVRWNYKSWCWHVLHSFSPLKHMPVIISISWERVYFGSGS